MDKSTRFLSLLTVGILALTWCAGETDGANASRPAARLAVTGPGLWVTPLELDFGPVGVGYTSAAQSVTITNVGDALLTDFAGGGVYPPFSAGQNCAPSVPPGGSCQYIFTFSPTAEGGFTTNSNSSTNAGPFSIILHGTGVGAGLHVSPTSLDFGSVLVGTTSAEQTVTIRNTGLATLTDFAGGGVSPPFSAGQTCAPAVPPGGSCQYVFTFSPTAASSFSTSSNSSTNTGPFTIELQGRGRTALFVTSGQKVTPRAIDFGPVEVGTTSGPVTVVVTNQSVFDAITGFAGGGVYPPFAVTQNCAPSLGPGASCEYFFTFSPTSAGTFTTTSKTTNSAGSFRIALRGTGVGASLTASPLVLDFGPVPLFTTSPAQVVTIRNTGPVDLTNWAGGGVYPPFSATQNCAGGIPPGGSCQYTFRFAPTAEGRFGAVSTSSTNGGSFSIQLYGGMNSLVFLPLVMR